MATTARRDTAPAPPRRRGQPVTRIAGAALALTAGAAAGVAGRTEVAVSFAVLGHLHWLWIPAAVLLEAASMAAFAIMLRRLLAAGGGIVGVRPLLAPPSVGPALWGSGSP